MTKALEWVKSNDWFSKDGGLTQIALGIHKKLVDDGIDPESDEYYEKVDLQMEPYLKTKQGNLQT